MKRKIEFISEILKPIKMTEIFGTNLLWVFRDFGKDYKFWVRVLGRVRIYQWSTFSMYGWMWAPGIWFLVLCVMLSKPLNLNKSFCDRALLSHCSPFDVFFSTTSPLHNTHYILMSFSPFSSDSLSFNLKLFRQKGKTFSFDIYMKYMLFSFKSYYLIVNSFHIINQTKQMLNKWF